MLDALPRPRTGHEKCPPFSVLVLTKPLKAGGNIGSVILKELLGAKKFSVTVLVRSDSKAKADAFGSQVQVRTVDYADPSTLVAALRGQDAVISALNHAVLSNQRALLDAAVSAGVQRFIPAEFGSDTLNPKAGPLPLYTAKKAEQKYFTELAAAGKISYTIIFTGPFLDFGLDYGFLGVDLKKRQVTYLDGGNAKFSTTTRATAARAVVGVLSAPEETKNRAVYVQDIALTLRDLFGLAKQALGDDGWTEIDGGTTEATEKASFEKLAKGQKDMGVFVGFLLCAIYREGYGGYFEKLDNELLGIQELKDSDVLKLIKEISEAQAKA